jgi:hypothetical protein
MKWLTYSGIAIIITLNPAHWRFVPWARKEVNEWGGPNEWTGVCGFLFLSIRVWIDNGSW